MSPRRLSFSLLVLASILSAAARGAEADDVRALIETDQRQQHAYVARDWRALEEIFTDDYVLVLWNGVQRTKAQILAEAAKPESVWEINETSGWQVRVHGDLGIVVAELHQKGTSGGQAFDSVVKFSDTYVREDGRWRNVHAHASKSVPVATP
jgi:ketosteroid isomerase-like protein